MRKARSGDAEETAKVIAYGKLSNSADKAIREDKKWTKLRSLRIQEAELYQDESYRNLDNLDIYFSDAGHFDGRRRVQKGSASPPKPLKKVSSPKQRQSPGATLNTNDSEYDSGEPLPDYDEIIDRFSSYVQRTKREPPPTPLFDSTLQAGRSSSSSGTKKLPPRVFAPVHQHPDSVSLVTAPPMAASPAPLFGSSYWVYSSDLLDSSLEIEYFQSHPHVLSDHLERSLGSTPSRLLPELDSCKTAFMSSTERSQRRILETSDSAADRWITLRDLYIEQLQSPCSSFVATDEGIFGCRKALGAADSWRLDQGRRDSLLMFYRLLNSLREVSCKIVSCHASNGPGNEKVDSYVSRMASDMNWLNKEPQIRWIVPLDPINNPFLISFAIDGSLTCMTPDAIPKALQVSQAKLLELKELGFVIWEALGRNSRKRGDTVNKSMTSFLSQNGGVISKVLGTLGQSVGLLEGTRYSF
jgi:hypothetical protein